MVFVHEGEQVFIALYWLTVLRIRSWRSHCDGKLGFWNSLLQCLSATLDTRFRDYNNIF